MVDVEQTRIVSIIHVRFWDDKDREIFRTDRASKPRSRLSQKASDVFSILQETAHSRRTMRTGFVKTLVAECGEVRDWA